MLLRRRTFPVAVIAEHAACLLRGDHLAAVIAPVKGLAFSRRNAHRLLMAALRAGDITNNFGEIIRHSFNAFWVLCFFLALPCLEESEKKIKI